MLLYPARLAYDIREEESIIFMDGEDIILVVLREFCKDNRVLRWADEIVRECVGAKRSIRVSMVASVRHLS
jgi:hypothetical protein